MISSCERHTILQLYAYRYMFLTTCSNTLHKFSLFFWNLIQNRKLMDSGLSRLSFLFFLNIKPENKTILVQIITQHQKKKVNFTANVIGIIQNLEKCQKASTLSAIEFFIKLIFIPFTHYICTLYLKYFRN